MDESERLVAPSLSTLAFERLENAIMQGEIKPGERLSESGLASRFGISRGPLREAIGQLEGRRLVERKYNLGARVVSLSNSDLIDLLVIRESLEGMACRMAAARLSTAQLGQLENMLVGHAKSEEVQSGRGYFQGRDDADFHQVILRECGNPRLIGLLDIELYSLLRLYRHQASMRSGRPAAALQEHRAIVKALKQRDGDRAEDAMRSHIRNSRTAFEQSLAVETTKNQCGCNPWQR